MQGLIALMCVVHSKLLDRCIYVQKVIDIVLTVVYSCQNLSLHILLDVL